MLGSYAGSLAGARCSLACIYIVSVHIYIYMMCAVYSNAIVYCNFLMLEQESGK